MMNIKNMSDLDGNKEMRNQLEDDIKKLKDEESIIDLQLADFFIHLTGNNQSESKNNTMKKLQQQTHPAPIILSLKKIEDFSPCFEAVGQDTKKLTAQIGECRILSEKMSKIVRRLDNMQIRAQLALACTEDIINLKECKIKMSNAIEEHDLQLAVNYLKQYHDIDEDAAKASDDIGALQQAERELKGLVKDEFNKAIAESNIQQVMSLCPLLQTLGLESEARDTFLNFMEANIFIAVSADISIDTTKTSTNSSTNNPDNTTTANNNSITTADLDNYAQSLSNVFNSTYLIFQQYLPIIIKGMELSYGDIYFIRKLHTRCEKQAAIVLKRYVKARRLKTVIQNVSSSSSSISSTTKSSLLLISGTNNNNNNNSSTYNSGNTIPSSADMHMILDELALLIQYCCMYSKYLSQLCQGAESRNRKLAVSSKQQLQQQQQQLHGTSPKGINNGSGHITDSTTVGAINNNNNNKLSSSSSSSSSTTIENAAIVFTNATDFAQMVDELINRYYMEGEMYLMRQGVKNTLIRLQDINQLTLNQTVSSKSSYMTGLDECFYVLKRCGQRALITSNIHAACAVLRVITDLIITELYTAVSDILKNATNKIMSMIQEYLSKFLKSAMNNSNNNTISDTESSLNMNNSYTGNNSMNTTTDFNTVVNVSNSTIQLGLMNAISLASSITGTTANNNNINNIYNPSFSSSSSSSATVRMSNNNTTKNDDDDDDDDEPDIWGVANYMKLISIAELSVRYCDQLTKEITSTGESVYGTLTTNTNTTASTNSSGSGSGSTAPVAASTRARTGSTTANSSSSSSSLSNTNTSSNSSSSSSSLSSEAEKLRLCREDFDSAKNLYALVLKNNIEKVGSVMISFTKEMLIFALSRNGLHGGIKFDSPTDEEFESQESVEYLPSSLITSLEFAINISTSHLSESCKDMMIAMMADVCCEKVEHLVSQTSFCFAGALKMEEISRALISLLSKHSSVSIRHKFSRLREINNVLTTDYSISSNNHSSSGNIGNHSNGLLSNNILMENYTHLTTNEVLAFVSLRLER